MLKLAHGLAFADLYSVDGAATHRRAVRRRICEAADAALAARLAAARAAPDALARKDESELLIALAPHLEDFVARCSASSAKCGRSRRGTTSSRRFTPSSASSSSARR